MQLRTAFKTAQNSFPTQGNRELPITLDFTNVGSITDSLYNEQQASQIEAVQSMFIDNSQNNAPFIIQFRKTQQRIVAQALTQGIYPVIEPGACEYTATTTPGIKIPVCFSNMQKDLAIWGPIPGVVVVPPLTNLAVELAPGANGDNILVAGVANQTIKVYRMILAFGAGVNAKWFSNPQATNHPLTGTFPMFAGGSMTMEPSGIPWFTTQAGESLNLALNGAVNVGGIIGFVQS